MKKMPLVILTILLLGWGVYLAWPEPAPVEVTPPQAEVRKPLDPESLATLTNEQRTANSLPALTVDPLLEQSAQDKCAHMEQNGYWAHTGAGRTWDSFIYAYKPRTAELIGENLGLNYFTSEAAVKGWMESPAHRANILEERYRFIGHAVCANMVVQHFSSE